MALGKPPRTSHTPSAISSASPPWIQARARVRALASLVRFDSGARAGRRQHAELAGDVAAVDVGLEALELVLGGEGEDVAALHLEVRAVGNEALERARAGERAGRAPLNDDPAAFAFVGADHVEDLPREVREGAVHLGRGTRARRRAPSSPR